MKYKDLEKNYDVRVLNRFKNTQMGLLDPSGKLIPVRIFGHFGELKKYSQFHDEIENFEDEVSDAYANFQPDPDGYGWHAFEIWQDGQEHDLRSKILKMAYDEGWGRIGLMMKRPKPHLVELETSGKNVAKLKRYAQDIAELLDANLNVVKVDQFEDK